MPGFESIVDQEKPVRLLSNILQKGKIPHALLFTGIEGVGKRDAAIAFAMACNCMTTVSPTQPLKESGDIPHLEGRFPMVCGTCKSCRKIISGNHPDVISIQPQKGQILIGQIREICQTLSLKPYEASYRFVIITDAHTMNPSAANSLLKVLEEPPDKTVLILTAGHLHDLLPTIASRCQHFRFNPISQGALVAFLKKEKALSAFEAELMATMARGSIAQARMLLTSGWMAWRKWILAMLRPGSTGASPLERTTTRLAFSEKLARDKDRISESLEILKTWYRDLMIYPLSPDKIVNQDYAHDLKQLTGKTDTAILLRAYDTIQSAQNKIAVNANPRLTIDVMLMNLVGFEHEKNSRHPL